MGRGEQKVGNQNPTNSSCNCAFARFAGQKSLGRLEQAGARRARSNVSRILDFLVDLCKGWYHSSISKDNGGEVGQHRGGEGGGEGCGD